MTAMALLRQKTHLPKTVTQSIKFGLQLFAHRPRLNIILGMARGDP